MGVPGFFAWIIKNYSKRNIVIKKLPDDNDNSILYIDANCLFHPQCFKILELQQTKLTTSKLEKLMIKRILNYIDFLILHVNPKQVFLSVDGVAPMAKMSQQRKRRFRSSFENKLKDQLKIKYNKQTINKWSNTCITPGTPFMEKLDEKIREHIVNKPIIYSSYNEKGEGEHKILNHIKNNSFDRIIIYGLDADLIFLSLASKKKNIFLLRESNQFDKTIHNDVPKNILTDVEEPLSYVSIDETKSCIIDLIDDHIDSIITKSMIPINIDHEKIDKIDFINDFIIICYFLGNDFIPNLPSIDIKTNGLNHLISLYCKFIVSTHMGLSNNNEINMNQLHKYIEQVSKSEDYYFKNILVEHINKMASIECPCVDPYDIEIWNYEHMKNLKLIDNVRLGQNDGNQYKYRYYQYYYGEVHDQTTLVNNICKNYIEGLVWTFNYYVHECDSYEWQYMFHNAPFLTDLSQYLNNNKNKVDKYVDKHNITPIIQLLSVLPPNCSELLPQQYRYLMTDDDSPIIDLFPTNIQFDYLYKTSVHKCEPFLPIIEIDRIINAVKN